jgi:hypothetical protein
VSLSEWTQEIEQIESIFNKGDLSAAQKKDLVFDLIKNKFIEKQDFKLFSSGDTETGHTRYRTNDGKFSLVVAIDGFRSKKWYFYAANDPNVTDSYNSLWEGKSYETEQQCVNEAESWLLKTFAKQTKRG